MAANNARKAVAQAQKNAATKQADNKPENPKVSELTGKMCNIIGGRKHKGETVGILWAALKPNNYGNKLARAYTGKDYKAENEIWIDQKYLEITDGVVPADVLAAYEKARQEQIGEMFYIAAHVGRETDKAVSLRYPGWYKDIWFPKADIEKTEKYVVGKNADGEASETPIYAIAAWRVRKEVGGDAYDALKAKQAELAKIVG